MIGGVKSLCFTIPGKPLPQKRPMVLRRGWTIDPPESKKEKKRIAGLALQAIVANGMGRFKGDIWLRVDFHGSRADIDNLSKLLMDALTGVVWKDDRQVKALNAVKNEKSKEPKTVVQVGEI